MQKKICTVPPPPPPFPISQKNKEIMPGGGGGVMVQKFVCVLKFFFDIQFKNTSNLKVFKTGLTF